LAKEQNVEINYNVVDLENFQPKESYYDLVVMIFLHLRDVLNQKIFNDSILSLKSKGKLIIETFNKEQINNSSGGPKNPELLFSEVDLLKLTPRLRTKLIESKIINLNEGNYHIGKANVIRFIGEKI
jgi:2-polyprenyl-3-methyl-5-hydroxy-6-metoxy-1,4-benzoquinol methylase